MRNTRKRHFARS